MILYNKLNPISVNIRKDLNIEDEDEDEDEFDGDLASEIKHKLSYAMNYELLDIEYISEDKYYKECDFCAKLVKTNFSSRGAVNQSSNIFTQRYVDEEEEYPSTNDCCDSQECIALKRKLTTFIRYGTEYYSQSEEGRERFTERFTNTGLPWKVPSSRQQDYLSILLGAELNVRVKEIKGFVDMIMVDEKIVIEYDGSGHFMGQHFGRYTYEEKLEEDHQRDLIVKSLGYKVIRIDSKNDYLPSDEEILNKINDIKSYFKDSGKYFFEWIIPKSKKEKRYGKLREITDEDIILLKDGKKVSIKH